MPLLTLLAKVLGPPPPLRPPLVEGEASTLVPQLFPLPLWLWLPMRMAELVDKLTPAGRDAGLLDR